MRLPFTFMARQHSTPHWWRPQLRMDLQTRSQSGGSPPVASHTSEQLSLKVLDWQRQGTSTVTWQGGQSPKWHFWGHGWPHSEILLQVDSQVGIGSVQDSRFLPFSNSITEWLPQGQVLMTLGSNGQTWVLAEHGWQDFWQRCWPHEYTLISIMNTKYVFPEINYTYASHFSAQL